MTRLTRLLHRAALASLPLLLGQTTEPATIDNPFYKAWADHKPGTIVTYKILRESPQGGGPVEPSEQQVCLLKVNPQEMTLEITQHEPDAGDFSHQVTYNAQVDKNREFLSGFNPETQANFVLKQASDGLDSLPVDGKPLECTTREAIFDYLRPNNPNPITYTMKYWLSPKVPGGYVQSATTIEFQGRIFARTTTTFADVQLPPANPPASAPASAPASQPTTRPG